MLLRRFRKQKGHTAAEIWVEIGLLRYAVELYENGRCGRRARGWRNQHEVEAHLIGEDFAALVRIAPDGRIACTWAR